MLEPIRKFFLSAFNKKKEQIVDRSLFSLFVHNFYVGNHLPPYEAQQRVESGVLEIEHPDGRHCGNGLLISHHGYFITCQHCLDNTQKRVQKMSIRMADGMRYPIERLCAQSQTYDLVIGKAHIPHGSPTPCTYRYCEKDALTSRTPLVLLKRREGTLITTGGFAKGILVPHLITQENALRKNFHEISLAIQPGDSGGVVTDTNGSILGLAVAKSVERSDTGYLINWFDIMRLVSWYTHKQS